MYFAIFAQNLAIMENAKITIQNTSSPDILKFESNTFLTQYESFEFNNIDEATNSPLAKQLFYLPFVKKIYISGNFVAIEKYNIIEWEDVKDELAQRIEEYINSGDPAVIQSEKNKKVAVTVYAESTPNPTVLKFVTNKRIVPATFEITNIDEAKISPLATELFHFPFVKAVFLDENYVSITKYDIAEWNDITSQLREFIKTFIENGNEVIVADATQINKKTNAQIEEDFEALDDKSKKIVNILEEYVKPAVASDGGNIQFESYDDTTKRVKVILQGACSGCPSSTFTLKSGIENMLKQMLQDEALTVEAVNG
jgi:Fe-S cluster biogenesis protein NfuA